MHFFLRALAVKLIIAIEIPYYGHLICIRLNNCCRLLFLFNFHISSYFADPDWKSLSDNFGILDGKSNSSFNSTILSHCISLVDFLHLHSEHQQIALKVMAEQPHRLKFAHMWQRGISHRIFLLYKDGWTPFKIMIIINPVYNAHLSSGWWRVRSL